MRHATVMCDRIAHFLLHVAWGGEWGRVEMGWLSCVTFWSIVNISFISLLVCHINYTFGICNYVIITSVKLLNFPVFIVKQSNISVSYTMSLRYDTISVQFLLNSSICVPVPVPRLFAAPFIVACVWTLFVNVALRMKNVTSHVCKHRLSAIKVHNVISHWYRKNFEAYLKEGFP